MNKGKLPSMSDIIRSLIPGNVPKAVYEKALELSMIIRGITKLPDGTFKQEGGSSTPDPRGGGGNRGGALK